MVPTVDVKSTTAPDTIDAVFVEVSSTNTSMVKGLDAENSLVAAPTAFLPDTVKVYEGVGVPLLSGKKPPPEPAPPPPPPQATTTIVVNAPIIRLAKVSFVWVLVMLGSLITPQAVLCRIVLLSSYHRLSWFSPKCVPCIPYKVVTILQILYRHQDRGMMTRTSPRKAKWTSIKSDSRNTATVRVVAVK